LYSLTRFQVGDADKGARVEVSDASLAAKLNRKCIHGEVNYGYFLDMTVQEWGKLRDLADELTYV